MVRRIMPEAVSADGAEVSYIPAERCAIVASPDGQYAAILEPGRVVVVEIARAWQVAELGVATAPEHTDIGWVGTAPPRLLIVSRRPSHSTVYLVDLDGPRAVAEIQIEGTRKLGATTGNYALIIGGASTAVLAAGDALLTPYQFPSRSVPTAAGAAGRQFVVSIAGAIEEWDPHQRVPRKRLRLPRQAAIAQVGGTDRIVWVTTQQDPAQIDVIAQAGHAQPRAHELPEPIAYVSAHPQRDLLVCLGRNTGSVYLVDLEGRPLVRTIELPDFPRADAIALFANPTTVGVLAARAGEPLGVFLLDDRPAAGPMVFATPSAPPMPEPRKPAPVPAASSLYDEPAEPDAPAPVKPTAASPVRISLAPARGGAGARPAEPPAAASAGLASLQLRNRVVSGPQLRRLGTQPPVPAPAPAPAPVEPVAERAPKRELSDAPEPPAIVRPPLELAMVALAPRTPPTRCSPADYQQLLDRFREFCSTT
ncbi:MAG TPA: hypothetical protein VGC42_03785, partial [Kofleriaceae bacterium]